MWAIRILTGPQSGQVISLKSGKTLIGRAPHCDFKLTSSGISKEHLEVQVIQDKIAISDLKSANGTFVNGIKIQNAIVRLGDKLLLNDIVLEIIMAEEKDFQRPYSSSSSPPSSSELGYRHGAGAGSYRTDGAAAYQANFPPSYAGMPGSYGAPYSQGMPHPQLSDHPDFSSQGQTSPPPPAVQQWREKFFHALDEVALPGLYALPKSLDYKLVLLSLLGVFIFLVTLISMIPTARLSQEAVVFESQRRALSLARLLAQANQESILSGQSTLLSTLSADNEEGVKEALIVQQSDGMILAPPTRAGRTPGHTFIHQARRESKSKITLLDSGTVGASFPISIFNPNTGEPIVKAHAVIVYDMSSRVVGADRLISLFIQNLVISSLLGLVLFFFLYKLIEYPLAYVNQHLDQSLREKTDNIQLDYQYPLLQSFLGNLNSLLNRYFQGSQDSAGSQAFVNFEQEAEKLVQMVGYPCVAMSPEGKVYASNERFEGFSRLSSSQLRGQSIQIIPDASFSQNIQNLLERSRQNEDIVHQDQLEFNGLNCELNLQGLHHNGSRAQLLLLTITPLKSGGE
jgi:hypothetical protein